MSRRDTIIVAVLINAGLLIVLFASALKSGSSPTEVVAAPSPAVQEVIPETVFKKELIASAGDEVDQALSQFSQPAMAAAPAPMAPAPAVAAPSSFADDLKPFPEVSSTSQQPVAQSASVPAVQTLTAPIAPQQRPSAEFTEIKVKKGDVLEKIARQHHTTVAEIMKANKLTSSNLRIGQTLKIPNKVIKKAEVSQVAYAPTAAASSQDAFSAEAGPKYYTVKKGDSPWTIAVKNHMKVDELLKLNNMSEEQSRRLKPGDQIRIK